MTSLDPIKISAYPCNIKCNLCQKRIKAHISLLGTCKCKKIFCQRHIQPEKHNCTFDYRAEFKEKLKRNNIMIVSDKIIRV